MCHNITIQTNIAVNFFFLFIKFTHALSELEENRNFLNDQLNQINL